MNSARRVFVRLGLAASITVEITSLLAVDSRSKAFSRLNDTDSPSVRTQAGPLNPLLSKVTR
jgi:hypothetical protein